MEQRVLATLLQVAPTFAGVLPDLPLGVVAWQMAVVKISSDRVQPAACDGVGWADCDNRRLLLAGRLAGAGRGATTFVAATVAIQREDLVV
jgi:hypothetical protein